LDEYVEAVRVACTYATCAIRGTACGDARACISELTPRATLALAARA
jgi:hypothetical protein